MDAFNGHIYLDKKMMSAFQKAKERYGITNDELLSWSLDWTRRLITQRQIVENGKNDPGVVGWMTTPR